MNELTTYLLILIIINQIIILYFVIRRFFATRRERRESKKLPMRKITKEVCEKLGGSVEHGRCIIRTQQGDDEIIEDIGGII